MKFIAGVCAAIAISAVGVVAQAPTTPQLPPTPQAPAAPQAGTEQVTPQRQAMASNLTEEITAIGCVRAWKPAPEEVTRMPEPKHGIFLLTPLFAGPATVNDVPTYLLTPTQIVNFAVHENDKVEVVGVAQTAPMPPTVQEIVNAPPRPENKPNAQAMPRLTIKSLRKVSDSCP
jgi:hypothetical protein